MVATSITTMGTGTMGAAVGANTSAVEVVVVVSVVAVDTATAVSSTAAVTTSPQLDAESLSADQVNI